MKKDKNSSISIKQIISTALFLFVAMFGGLNAYRIVSYENVNTIQAIETANVEQKIFESALVENTEDDVVIAKNINFLAAKIISETDLSGDNLGFAINEKSGTNTEKYSDKVISRGNYVREQVANQTKDNSNILLNSVLNEIKELSEKQEQIIEDIVSKEENVEDVISTSEENIKDVVLNEEKNVEDVVLVENQNIENVEVEIKEEVIVEEVAAEIVSSQESLDNQLVPPTEYVKTIDVKATAYCLCKKCCGKSPSNPAYGVTASGLKIIPGNSMKVVASDPSVIPLGTNVYIEGLYGAKDYGYAIVADTGSAIKNLKIDLYMDTHQMALNWGVKSVRVYILGE